MNTNQINKKVKKNMSESLRNSEPIDPMTHFGIVKAARGLVGELIKEDNETGVSPVLNIAHDSRGNKLLIPKPVYEMDVPVPSGWTGEYLPSGADTVRIIIPVDKADEDPVMRISTLNIRGYGNDALGSSIRVLVPLTEDPNVVSTHMPSHLPPTDAMPLNYEQAAGLIKDLVSLHEAMQ